MPTPRVAAARARLRRSLRRPRAGSDRRRGASAAPFEDTIAQRVLACTGCHGREGRAAPDGYYPRIAGKPAGYLFNQLLNFRDERRHYELMDGLLALLDDAYLREIADHFAALDLPYPPPLAPAGAGGAARRGEALVRRGDPARGLPGVQRLPRRAMTGARAVHPGPARPAARLPQRPARRLEQRQARARRRPTAWRRSRQRSDARGHRRGLGLARGAAGAGARERGRGARGAAADRLRRRRRCRRRGRAAPRRDEARPGSGDRRSSAVAAVVLLAAAAVAWLNRDDDARPRADAGDAPPPTPS